MMIMPFAVVMVGFDLVRLVETLLPRFWSTQEGVLNLRGSTLHSKYPVNKK